MTKKTTNKEAKANQLTKPTKPTTSRRKAIKTLAISGGVLTTGAAMPTKWAKPVVDSIVLPSHAVTTGSDTAGTENTTTPIPTLNMFGVTSGGGLGMLLPRKTRSFAERTLDLVIPTAQANHRINQFDSVSVCAMITGTSFTARITRLQSDNRNIFDYNGLAGTVDSPLLVSGIVDPCDGGSIGTGQTAQDISMLIQNVTATTAQCVLTNVGGSGGALLEGGEPEQGLGGDEVIINLALGPCVSPDLTCNNSSPDPEE